MTTLYVHIHVHAHLHLHLHLHLQLQSQMHLHLHLRFHLHVHFICNYNCICTTNSNSNCIRICNHIALYPIASHQIALQHNKNSTESSGEDVGRRLQNGFGKGHRGDDSVIYGWNAINEFLQETGCELIMRAHEATAGGVKICKHAKVITVFST